MRIIFGMFQGLFQTTSKIPFSSIAKIGIIGIKETIPVLLRADVIKTWVH